MLMERVTTNVRRTVLLSLLMQFTNYLLENKNDKPVETADDPSNFTPITVVSTPCSTDLLFTTDYVLVRHFLVAFLILASFD